jgi:hypothetical protein
MRAVVFLAFLLVGGCGTSASPGTTSAPATGDGGLLPDGARSATGGLVAIPDAPASGVVNGAPFVLRSASLRIVGDQHIITLRDYASDCGTVQGSLPGDNAVSLHVVVFLKVPGEERIAYADDHNATFQIGVQPPNVKTFPVREGAVRFDTLSFTPGDTVKGALTAKGDPGDIAGTFSAGVCTGN